MNKEAFQIMKRRFTGRAVESALLIFAIALGVGASTAGLSLVFHTNNYSTEVLSSAEYREIVIATNNNFDDMDQPVIEKDKTDNIVLTELDLKASEIVPQISYAYISSDKTIRILSSNGKTFGRSPGGDDRPAQEESGENVESSDPPQNEMISEMMNAMEEIKDDPSYIQPNLNEISGYEVTDQFFYAWSLETVEGSLFTESDYTSSDRVIVLGNKIAENFSAGNPLSSLIGKKILGIQGVYTIIGVLEMTNNDFDGKYLTVENQQISDDRFRPSNSSKNNRQLRFTVSDPSDLDEAAALLTNWFNNQYGVNQVVVSNPRAEAEKVIDRSKGIGILILFLSLSGLFIASVNVSNILMGRSLRMKKHIGILKALGASKVKILTLFAGEALLITIIGSLLGLALAIPLSNSMQQSLDMGNSPLSYLIAGTAISFILTIIFSIFPSLKSSNLGAADAMRTAN